jgi:DNA-binding MarR family transcriptional regulator
MFTRVTAPAPADLVQRLIGLVNRRGSGESIGHMHRSGLTMPQIVVLFSLRRSDASISELAARLRMSLPATSQLVDRLVEAGHVDRSEDPADRRVKRIRIRPAGLQFLERLGELRSREIEGALAALGPETRALLTAALDAAVRELEADLQPRGAEPAPATRRRP